MRRYPLRADRGSRSVAKRSGELVRDYFHLILERDLPHLGSGPNAPIFSRRHHGHCSVHSARCSRLFQSAATKISTVGGGTGLLWNWQPLPHVFTTKSSTEGQSLGALDSVSLQSEFDGGIGRPIPDLSQGAAEAQICRPREIGSFVFSARAFRRRYLLSFVAYTQALIRWPRPPRTQRPSARFWK